MTKLSLFFFTAALVLFATTASARPQREPFRLTMTALDAKTHRPRSTFALGEPVRVHVSITNQSRVARTIIQLEDGLIPLRLSAMLDYENGPDIHEGYLGGATFSSRVSGGMTIWYERQPRMMTLRPGQTVSLTIDDLGRHFYEHPFQEGSYTLSAKYNSSVRASISFRVMLDEKKTIPLLEELASAPVKDGRDSLQRWAKISLDMMRLPWISGRIVDTEGQPLKEVRIMITGTLKTNLETRHDGRYRLEFLTRGGTYTITPEIPYYDSPGETHYTLEPTSRTISSLNEKLDDVNFLATRIRVSTNVALEEEGSKARASSIKDTDFEPENVINGFRNPEDWGAGSEGWNDGTPNSFPDWIEVDFGRTRRLNWINVYTLPDNYKDSYEEPELTHTFSQYGVTDFDVQYWTGRHWLNVPGGAIRGNRNVWRKISFPVVTTNKIRVVVLNAMGGESRIIEIEAFHLNDLPQAKIVANGKGHTKSLVHFDTKVFDIDGSIRNYELDFGDDSDEYEWSFDYKKAGDKPLLTHSHVYEKEGTYKVTLRVVDDSNESSETTFMVTITDPVH